MAITLYHTGTEYLANAITLLRGAVTDIQTVGVYHNVNPNYVPLLTDFTTVNLVDGTATPLPALAESGIIDILSLVGARAGAVTISTPGTYQRFVYIKTASEDIIRAADTIVVL